MATATKNKKRYHCDGYYETGVCRCVGNFDAAFTHRTRKGFVVAYETCKTDGISPMHGFTFCPHCVENKRQGLVK